MDHSTVASRIHSCTVVMPASKHSTLALTMRASVQSASAVGADALDDESSADFK